jgi:hypothetical protein
MRFTAVETRYVALPEALKKLKITPALLRLFMQVSLDRYEWKA